MEGEEGGVTADYQVLHMSGALQFACGVVCGAGLLAHFVMPQAKLYS